MVLVRIAVAVAFSSMWNTIIEYRFHPFSTTSLELQVASQSGRLGAPTEIRPWAWVKSALHFVLKSLRIIRVGKVLPTVPLEYFKNKC